MNTRSIPRPLAALLLLLGLCVHPAGAGAQAFVHPGGLHTRADLDRMKEKVAAGAHPWIDGWNALIADPKAQNDYHPTPAANMGVSRQRAQNDAAAAYLNALRWYISGDRSYADCAARILNGWSAAVDQVPTGNDQPGLGGIPIGSFTLAAEVLRTCPDWTQDDQARFKRMLLTYFYPVCHDFLIRHNDAGNSHFWANWDTANMRAILGIGVFCDDRAKFDEAVEYYRHGAGTGAIANAVPFRYPGGLGQWQESGRDQAHVMGGMGLLCEFCQMAWNQGVDLFGHDDNRLLAGAEYAAQYTLWKGVPYTYYDNSDHARQFYISQNYHGRLQCSHYELLYNHYAVRQGLKTPNVKLLAELKRPESGDVDAFGYGTLTFTLDAVASPVPSVTIPPVPQDLTATPGLGRVDLAWSPSGAYTARGYEVLRAPAANGPYASIYSTENWTTPRYTDTQVQPGTRYYYAVAALNQAGKSAPSAAADAPPAAGSNALPEGWRAADGVQAAHAGAAGGSFSVAGSGGGFERDPDRGNFVGLAVKGDLTITARLIDRRGGINLAGLVIRDAVPGEPRAAALTVGGVAGPQVTRDAAPGGARAVALTLGESGGRQTRFRTWPPVGNAASVQLGDDYTWIPVWFRLQRVGNTFTAFQSSDGIEWFEVGRSTVDMSPSCLAGLLTDATDKPGGAPAEAAFDHVSVEPQPPAPPMPPAGLTATASLDEAVALAWKNAADGRMGIKVEASVNNGPFYEIADLAAGANAFVNTGLRNPAALRYRVRAYNTGGYSAYTEPAAVPSAGARGQQARF